jgi:hypothetical protein
LFFFVGMQVHMLEFLIVLLVFLIASCFLLNLGIVNLLQRDWLKDYPIYLGSPQEI